MKYLSRVRAFTLIELLVVIAIITLLTGIIMANLTGTKSKARDAKRISDVGNLQLALELFYDRCRTYPINQLTLDDTGGGSCPSGITLGSFIAKIPTDPSTGQDYFYDSSGSSGYTQSPAYAQGYYLRATLETQNPALSDDVDVIPSDIMSNSVKANTYCADSPNLYYCVISR